MAQANYQKLNSYKHFGLIKFSYFSLTMFAMSILPALGNAQTTAFSLLTCPISTAIPPRPLVTESIEKDDIYIAADNIEYTEGGTSRIIGNAELSYNDQQASADKIEYFEHENSLILQGKVNYWDNDLFITSPGGKIDINNNTGEFAEVQYWLLGNRGRGNAKSVLVELDVLTEGKKVDYTTCDPDSKNPWNLTRNIWSINASTLVLNHTNQRGSGWNVILKIKDIPVFYTPYISFPIGDRRKSGLLVPTFGSSSRYGTEIQTPYYWIISERMDATITPRFISNSGLMMTGEYRYLLNQGAGTLNLEYLPNDSIYDEKDRYSVAFQHKQSFLNDGQLSIVYNRVSDKKYLENFSSTLIGTSTRFLQQSATASYSWYFNGHKLNFHNLVGNYQLIDRNIPITSRPYKRLPSSTITYSSPYKNRQLYYNLTGKLDAFDRDKSVAINNIDGIRYDLFPSISYPINDLSYYLVPKVGMRYTSYQLEKNSSFNDKTPNRFVPILSLDGGLFFERNTNLLGEKFLQTLEPRIYYLYVPDHDQSNLPIFDTGQFNLNFASLFFENRFNGIDRLGDTNQLSFALTSHLYNGESGQQLGNFSIGQAIYLKDRNVVLPGHPIQNEAFSAIIARFESNLSQNLDLSGEFQWDPDKKRTQKLTLRAQYRPEKGKVLNLGYRKHRADTDIRTFNYFNVDQTDMSFKWSINPEWSIVGKWNYALEESRTLDLFGGIEYNSCCWNMRVVARKFLSNLVGDYETGFFMQIELKGLAGLGGKTLDFLRMNIPGYEDTF